MTADDCPTFDFIADVAARYVIPGDTIEVPAGNGTTARAEVLDVVVGVVWVAGERLPTVLLVTEPAEGRGHAFGADDPVLVVYEMPDYPPDYTPGPVPAVDAGCVALW